MDCFSLGFLQAVGAVAVTEVLPFLARFDSVVTVGFYFRKNGYLSATQLYSSFPSHNSIFQIIVE